MNYKPEVVTLSYDPQTPDSYTVHLGCVSERQGCTALQDIHNEFGLLLVKKGTPISAQLAVKMAGHRLDQAIDDAVGLDAVLTPAALLKTFQALSERYRDVSAIQAQREAQGLLETLCFSKPFPGVLLQKLSVMQLQLPERFEISLLGAWLSALLALAAQWSSERIYQVFCAALFRDLGLLHIDEKVVRQEGLLSGLEKRSVVVHPRISQRILIDRGDYPEEVPTAVSEHHEHPAGVGFPSGKTCESMSEMGQLLALVDFVCRSRCDGGQKTLRDTIPYLKVAVSIYQVPIYHVAYRLFLSTNFPPAITPEQDAQRLSEQAIDRLVSIGAVFAFMVSLQGKLTGLDLDSRGRRFSKRIELAINLLRTSGLASIDLISLLDELKQGDTLGELRETEILENEFLYIAEHTYRLGGKWLLKDTDLKPVFKHEVGQLLQRVEEALLQCECMALLEI